jgi:hypothetical protein
LSCNHATKKAWKIESETILANNTTQAFKSKTNLNEQYLRVGKLNQNILGQIFKVIKVAVIRDVYKRIKKQSKPTTLTSRASCLVRLKVFVRKSFSF